MSRTKMTTSEQTLDQIEEEYAALKGAERWLTPNPKEQVVRILAGKCPHNKGWKYEGHGHNDETYSCNLCGTLDYY